ncbi:hypothetical protein FHX06_007184 [Rhizobium sp. BK512]|nr:hypothetical protein [Rhizobium sp. BK512]
MVLAHYPHWESGQKRQRMFRRFEVHFWTMVALLAGYGLYGLGKLIVVCWVN